MTFLLKLKLPDGILLFQQMKITPVSRSAAWNIILQTTVNKQLVRFFLLTQKIFLRLIGKQKIVSIQFQMALFWRNSEPKKSLILKVALLFLQMMTIQKLTIAGFGVAGGIR